jgi:UDP-3-O-[3-hydroxymyristoyl] glucosamine N-acyltransferase
MKISLDKIAKYIDGEIIGNPQIEISNIAKIEEAKEGDISFLANPKYTPFIYSTQASAVIVNEDFVPEKPLNTTLLKVKDSYQAFSKLLEVANAKEEKKGIENPSFIHPETKIGKNVYIGAFAYISKGVKIGDNVKIYPHCFIGENVEIGNGTTLFSNVSVYHECKIGKQVTIHAGAVIGADGFGFAPNNGSHYKKVPQIGNVIIEDHVEIGANTSIDRATLGSTIIRKGVKLDNFIQVAHNVEIGENTVIAAHTGISGSSKIGKNCMIGGQVGIAGHLQIGDNVKVGAQSGISKNIKDNEIVIGSPALPYRNFKKSSILFKNLDDLYQRLQALEKKLNE